MTHARHFIEQRQQSGVKRGTPLYTPDIRMEVVETESGIGGRGFLVH